MNSGWKSLNELISKAVLFQIVNNFQDCFNDRNSIELFEIKDPKSKL